MDPTKQYTILENDFLSKAACMHTTYMSVLCFAQHNNTRTVQQCYYFDISGVHLLPVRFTRTSGPSNPFVIISITLSPHPQPIQLLLCMDCFQIDVAIYTVAEQIGFLGISGVEGLECLPQMALNGGSVMDLWEPSDCPVLKVVQRILRLCSEIHFNPSDFRAFSHHTESWKKDAIAAIKLMNLVSWNT